MSEIKVTKEIAYLAMYSFLEQYYLATGSDDVGGLLGSMSLLPDGAPMDEAVRGDWENAVTNAVAGKVDATLRLGHT